MDVPATIAAELGILRQNVALSVIKQSAEQSQKLVEILDQSARTAPVSGTHGTHVNFKA